MRTVLIKMKTQPDPSVVHVAKKYWKFYEAISPDKWCVGDYERGDQACAVQHIRRHQQEAHRNSTTSDLDIFELEELLIDVGNPITINDGHWLLDKPVPSHPRDRILAALKLVMGAS